ncbi:S8 family serine peptidase [Postechiella marina]|uniref:S8 family serine peptidase n=1 Tax=Postechiella marina TaxID=943941 RepID=A0ABP8CIH4_9FLAO
MKKYFLFLTVLCFHFYTYAQQDAWVYFIDKPNVSASIANPTTILTQKAIDRKSRHNITIDARDVPVNESYIAQLKMQTGITVYAKSKWFNAVHVRGSETNIKALINLAFVNQIEFADKSINTSKPFKDKAISKLESVSTTYNYGNALNQIEMFNGDKLHALNYTGTGVTVAVLDAGFPKVNTMSAFAKLRNEGRLLNDYDFVNRDNDVYTNTTSNHGTLVLSDMAAYIENQFVGTAPNASYYLFITEDATSENPVEESYWVEAAERADSLGVDIINTSLGYKDYGPTYSSYTYSDSELDGKTAYITKGANIAFEKGIMLVVSAGNSGNDGVGAPADSQYVLSIGAVKASGDYATFSSVGSAIQPSQKPDVVAQGQASYVITENDVITTANGTSFSSPILAGGIACLMQALPNSTNAEIMELVKASASLYTTPNYQLGYGIPDLDKALSSALSSTDATDVIDNVKLYPNPSQEFVFIDLPNLKAEANIRFYDVLGKLVLNHTVNQELNKIDVLNLSLGLYIVKIESSKKSITLKFIKD